MLDPQDLEDTAEAYLRGALVFGVFILGWLMRILWESF